MAVSKVSLFCVALILASNYNLSYGDDSPLPAAPAAPAAPAPPASPLLLAPPAEREPADFWLTFSETLAGNFINWLVNLDIVPNELVSAPVAPVAPAVPSAPIVSVIVPGPEAPPAVAPPAVAPPAVAPPAVGPPAIDPSIDFWKNFLALYNSNFIRPPPATTANPCTSSTVSPCTDGECKPEQVRIVLVNDCEEHKDSSESCSHESSEEIVYKGRYARHTMK